MALIRDLGRKGERDVVHKGRLHALREDKTFLFKQGKDGEYSICNRSECKYLVSR